MEEKMFQPFQLASLTLPNRVVMTTVKLGYASKHGEINSRHLAFYTRRAQGGAGLIVSEPMYIQPNGREIPTQLGIYGDELIAGLRSLTDAVHVAGGKMMAHINHAGRAANPKLVAAQDMVSASDVTCSANQATPRPLSIEQVQAMVSAFGEAARRAREAGFDALEIPFSHGYLIHQFLSPLSNRREDEYGGSFENRLRFGAEVLAAARAQVGGDFPIVVRLNAQDYAEGGLTLEDAVAIGQRLKVLGADAISVTSGTMCESVPFCMYPNGTPKANLLPMAARIRADANLPVIVAGRVRTPAVAREALAAGQTDLIGLGRPFLADPDWVAKAKTGQEASIVLCASCHQGCLAELRLGYGTHCMLNPLTGREGEVDITPAAQPRNVLVVGGGPAGLEAATIAAQRGHRVTLYEQEAHLGGQFRLAAQAPHKEEFLDTIHGLAEMAKQAKVDIRLGKKASAQTIQDSHADMVILATGGVPLTIPFPGLEQTRWVLAADLLDGAAQVNSETALVIGGGLVGLESADYLASRGVKVSVVEMLPQVGAGMDMLARNMLLNRLKKQGVTLHAQTKVTGLGADEVLVEQEGVVNRLPIETVVMAVGVRANRELPDDLENSGLAIHVIGDAVKPRNVLEAIWEGFEMARQI
jgi:2,4-dienoyl-CoA reductase-like NADH-dependent reductase (Old Yellow Enzyme family)/thioredoxin reductase